MSFTLYLKPARFDREAIGRYFSKRSHYLRTQSPDGAAHFFYENPDTGVYFSFWLEENARENQDDSMARAERRPTVMCNINYFRPHVFALEAESEIAAFIERFECEMFDPQDEGMGEGPFLRDDFLHSYNTGNALGYCAVLAKAKLRNITRDYLVAETDDIGAVWSWNRNRARTQAAFEDAGRDLFAPRLIWGKVKQTGQEIIFAIWAEDVSTAIPALATHVLLVRPTRRSILERFSAALKKTERPVEARLVPMSMLQGERDLHWEEGRMGQFLWAPAIRDAPPAIGQLFVGPFRPPRNIVASVAEDHVLNTELVIAARLEAGR
jgi:hypothetical protein